MFQFLKQHENYKELIWVLAKTDFKLRYHGSVLGYVWALLQPLAMFAVLNFVFSSIFARGGGEPFYSLQLIVGIMMFTFFSEGTSSGMKSLLSKSQLITKTYVPKWTIILSSTIHSVLTYLMSLIIVVVFFIWKGLVPSFGAVMMFLFFSFLIYVIIVSFSFLTASLFIRFRDLAMIWGVVTQMLFYATPIVYPLKTMTENMQQLLLANPLAFIVHFTKESLINDHFPDLWQINFFIVLLLLIFIISIFVYKKTSKGIAENF
ncbi:MAG: ABC transporter permease [Candidatus Moranbacteria bacterium]|nr:ABC transporter permease [Candidatus Moranbacteria bacterium]